MASPSVQRIRLPTSGQDLNYFLEDAIKRYRDWNDLRATVL